MPVHDATFSKDINPIEFLEDYLGIKLFAYQKEILRRMLSDKTYIHPWHSYERPGNRLLKEIAKCCLLINDDADKQMLQVKKEVQYGLKST